PALRRRAAARGDRSRVRERPDAAVRRRAVGQPRPGDRRRGRRAHVPPQSRARHHARARHPRHDAGVALYAAPLPRGGTARRRRARELMALQTLRMALRMLSRDARARELDVLVAAIVLAVASVGTVGFFTERVRAALTREANLLIGADVMISGDRPLPAAFADEARQRGLVTSPVVRFNSMVTRPADDAPPVLATVKAVAPGYPLRGSIVVADAASTAGVTARGIPPPGVAWPDVRLVERLKLVRGARIALGDATFEVGDVVLQEPEIATGLLTGAPRVLINAADLAATQLLQPGNRATYRLLVADDGAPSRLDRYIDWAKAALKTGQRMETVRDAQPEIRQTLERAEKFLALASLVAVMLAAVAIALAASRYLRRHLDTAAIVKCLGASRARTLALFAIQFVV